MSGSREERAAYVRSLRAQLRADGERNVKDDVALELMEELLPYLSGDAGSAAGAHRAAVSLLHRHRRSRAGGATPRPPAPPAAAGDSVAKEVLALLGDDPFWR